MEAKIINFQTSGALGIVQLSTPSVNSLEFISGNSALKNGELDVREVSESGSVNDLTVSNRSLKFVFLMDGDILTGAKQDRVLNTSVLLKPQSRTVIPVSCIERGRWERGSKVFYDIPQTVSSDLRAGKARTVRENLKSRKEYTSDQFQVWAQVNKEYLIHKVTSPTDNYSELYSKVGGDIDGLTQDISVSEEANGMAFFIRKKLLNVDIFGRNDIYTEYFPKLLRSAGLSALNVRATEVLGHSEAEFKALSFLDKFDTIKFDRHPGVSAGEELRYETAGMTGFELIYNTYLVHLAGLSVADETAAGE